MGEQVGARPHGQKAQQGRHQAESRHWYVVVSSVPPPRVFALSGVICPDWFPLALARKYKTYNKIRDMLAGKTEANARKRKPTDAAPSETPSKRLRTATAQTPSNTERYGSRLDAVATPSTARKLFSPAVPTSIGPTPQRDGRVLGLFDLLAGTDAPTPSKSAGGAATQPLGAATLHTDAIPIATPSRQAAETTARLGRTPQRGFATPLKPRDANALGGRTPTRSVSKLQFATPAFLRRAPPPVPLPRVDENGAFVASPGAVRLPRKPLLRTLSSVVAGLRRMEDEHLDDDLDALREMESEGAPPRVPPAKATDVHDGDGNGKPGEPDALEPAQPLLLGGFDDESKYDSPTEEPAAATVGRDGKPLPVYKKKAPKRTTRRVNMRPTRTRRPAGEAEPRSPFPDDDDDGSGGGGDVVPEPQTAAAETSSEEQRGLLSGSESNGSSGNEEHAKKDEAKKKRKKKGETAKPAAKEEGTVRKAARKVNELAHANFKRLKLRNSGSKGGPGHNSRFRRRL